MGGGSGGGVSAQASWKTDTERNMLASNRVCIHVVIYNILYYSSPSSCKINNIYVLSLCVALL